MFCDLSGVLYYTYPMFRQLRLEVFGKLFVRKHLHIFVVEPLRFLNVKLGSALAYMADVERLDEFLH